MKKSIPVIDLFAGPGGLSEGFTSARGNRFKIALSIEKDPIAHRTLRLRAFYRQYAGKRVPEIFYKVLRGDISDSDLFNGNLKLRDSVRGKLEEANREAMCATLGKEPEESIDNAISKVLSGRNDFVLIGGPPCQAYSLAGRSRNKGIESYRPEEDERHYLYREYLRIISRHWPAVFVMENVKGMVSSRVNGSYIFHSILDDLRDPAAALKIHPEYTGYRIYSLVAEPPGDNLFSELDYNPMDYVIKCERYGIPQARHRVILMGIRDDINTGPPELLNESKPVNVNEVLTGMPVLRGSLTKEYDGREEWQKCLKDAIYSRWLRSVRNKAGEEVQKLILETLGKIKIPVWDRGAEFIPGPIDIDFNPGWYLDHRLNGTCNSSTRGHIRKDLYRYLFASCFASIHSRSPKLMDFPADLLPEHENANEEAFVDRFKVQLNNRPASTITSHISKDGHYYIHPDPSQCRSLTVREAARLQTFPDNYFFCGNRTQQYHQVGNAVPPLLARQVATIVNNLLSKKRKKT